MLNGSQLVVLVGQVELVTASIGLSHESFFLTDQELSLARS
ncbi:hypothetical protein DSUL_60119 [Desulfovibrionales bacterium]